MKKTQFLIFDFNDRKIQEMISYDEQGKMKEKFFRFAINSSSSSKWNKHRYTWKQPEEIKKALGLPDLTENELTNLRRSVQRAYGNNHAFLAANELRTNIRALPNLHLISHDIRARYIYLEMMKLIEWQSKVRPTGQGHDAEMIKDGAMRRVELKEVSVTVLPNSSKQGYVIPLSNNQDKFDVLVAILKPYSKLCFDESSRKQCMDFAESSASDQRKQVLPSFDFDLPPIPNINDQKTRDHMSILIVSKESLKTTTKITIKPGGECDYASRRVYLTPDNKEIIYRLVEWASKGTDAEDMEEDVGEDNDGMEAEAEVRYETEDEATDAQDMEEDVGEDNDGMEAEAEVRYETEDEATLWFDDDDLRYDYDAAVEVEGILDYTSDDDEKFGLIRSPVYSVANLKRWRTVWCCTACGRVFWHMRGRTGAPLGCQVCTAAGKMVTYESYKFRCYKHRKGDISIRFDDDAWEELDSKYKTDKKFRAMVDRDYKVSVFDKEFENEEN